MFADPFVLAVGPPTGATTAVALTGSGATTLSFVATGRGPFSSTYRYGVSSSHWIDMFISRQVGKRSRYTVRLTEVELVTDPINSELSTQKTTTAYIVLDVGVLGTGTNWSKMLHALAYILYKPTDATQVADLLLIGNT